MVHHNLRTVVRFEVGRTLGRKKFWLITLLVPAAIAIVIALIVLANSSAAGTAADQSDKALAFTYSDASGLVDPAIASALGGTVVTDDETAIAEVRAGESKAHFVFAADPATTATAVYGADQGVFGNSSYENVAIQLLVASSQAEIGNPTLAALAQGNVPVTSTTFVDGEVNPGFMGVLPPLIFLVLFFLTFVLLSNQMLTVTLEEKENRVTEMILTTVNPTALIGGKIIALFVVGFVQVVFFALPLLIGYLFFRTSLSLPDIDLASLSIDPGRMIVGALLALGGFALFTGTLVAIGAVMPTAKDAGGMFTALMLLMFVPLYAVSLILSNPTGLVVQIFTYFPYSAPVTAMIRNAVGTLNGWEATIVIVVLFALSAVVLRLAVRLFRYGSIQYTSKLSLKTMLSAWRGKRALH
jgi:ABC-2 type transport system permease protein